MKKILILVICLLSLNSFSAMKSLDEKEKLIECKVLREYATTLQFLRGHKAFGIKESEARKVADRVSHGCTGASKRFIQITNILLRAGLGAKESIEHGIKFAIGDDARVSNFRAIFKQAFISKYLDLPIMTALNIALKLSYEFDGTQKFATEDFNTLVKFCMSAKHLNLPVPTCAQTAARITTFGAKFDKQIAKSFIKIFKYTTSKSGPNRAVFAGLKLSETIVQNGPQAVENFIDAYKFGVSKKGLNLGQNKSINFALGLAKRTIKAEL